MLINVIPKVAAQQKSNQYLWAWTTLTQSQKIEKLYSNPWWQEKVESEATK